MTESSIQTPSPLWFIAYYDDEDDVHGFYIAETDNHMTALSIAGPVCCALCTKGAAIPPMSHSVYYPHRNRFIPWDEAIRILGIPRPDQDWALPRETEIN